MQEHRLGIHQLFPLLVHACMFGGGYGARAGTIAARYACARRRGLTRAHLEGPCS